MKAGLALWLLAALTGLVWGSRDGVEKHSPRWGRNANYLTWCDFEDDVSPFCEWTPVGWMRMQTGADEVHLTQEDVLLNPHGDARLTSTLLNVLGNACVEFRFRKSAWSRGELEVLLRKAGAEEGRLWSSAGSPVSSWQHVSVPLVSAGSGLVQVVFQARRRLREDTGIAVDDVGVRRGLCDTLCGSNSHYNSCASGCPAACSTHDVPGQCRSCEGRCQCDPGFLLSGGRCVREEDCGCWSDGQHYQKGVQFMVAGCESVCSCAGGGRLHCFPANCQDGYVCKVKDGLIGCYPSAIATCQVFGDPHFITFDGKLYNFQGACNYTLASACGDSPTRFTVTLRNENRQSPAWSAVSSVALQLPGLHVALRRHGKVYVNGEQTPLPADPSEGVSLFVAGPYVQLESRLGLRVLFDGEQRVFLQVSERHKGALCGLCGTYTDNQFDDFLTPGGELVGGPQEFAESWRVKDEEWPCADPPPPLPACHPQLESQAYQKCTLLFEEPFKPCHWFVPPQLFVSTCVYDYCGTAGDPRQLCLSLESYVAACQVAEVLLGDWHKGTICEHVTPTATGAPTTHTAPSQACPLDCDFERNTCGWWQLVTDSFDWVRHKGATPSDFTGPSRDHSTGDGYYLYIEGDGVQHGDSARLLSPPCQATGPSCFQFWYHMYGGAFAMALNFYLLQGNTATRIWAKANNQGDRWHLGQVDISIIGSYQIIAEGIRGSNPLSDVALDDFSIWQGPCSRPDNQSAPTVYPGGGHE